MSRRFVSRYEAMANCLTAEIDRTLSDMNAAQQQADTLSEQAKNTNENGVVFAWSSPQQLRTWSQAEQQAQHLFESALQRGAVRGRVLFRAYQHAAWCAVRSIAYALRDTVRLTLSQVAALFTPLNVATDHDPPGLLLSCSVLATCQASNAPGLSPAVTYWQVRPE